MRSTLVALVLMAVLVGCGSDGSDGDAFIAINWIGTPFYYNDNNPAIPYQFYAGEYYPAVVGTFSFVYQAWDQSIWDGSITISVNPGEDGGFFPWSDGEDGEDKYFTLWLLSSGPMIESSALAPSFPVETQLVATLNAVQPRTAQKSEPDRLPEANSGTVREIQEVDLGTYHVRLEYFEFEPLSSERR